MPIFDVEFLSATVRLCTPLLLAALGDLICERSGVMNITIEGIMLGGAFAGAYWAVLSGSCWTGVLFSGLVGVLSGLLLAWLCVTLKADQIVVGISLNLVALGVTTFLYAMVFVGPGGTAVRTPTLAPWPVPGLSELPVIGSVLFRQPPLFYVALAVLLLEWLFLSATHLGLMLRATGEHARAANSLGINVDMVRYLAVLVGSGLIGVAGSYLSLVEISTFQPNLTGGRGFLALAAVIFGKWKPGGVVGAVLLFAAAEALQFRLQGLGLPVPPQFFNLVPYVLAIVALVGVVGGGGAPREVGRPFIREEV